MDNVLNIIQIVTNVTAMAGVFIAVLTLRASNKSATEAKDIAKGEFVHNLHNEFSNNDYGLRIFDKCWREYCGETVVWDDSDNEDIVKYLTFFETLYFMLDKKILNISELDDLFRRRFFVVVNNAYVQNKELLGNSQTKDLQRYKYYKNIYLLHAKWKVHDKGKENFYNNNQDLEENLKILLGEELTFYNDIYDNREEGKNK